MRTPYVDAPLRFAAFVGQLARRNSSSGTATPGPPSMTTGDMSAPLIASRRSHLRGSAAGADAPFALGVCKASSQGRLVILSPPVRHRGGSYSGLIASPAGQAWYMRFRRLQSETYSAAKHRPQACKNRKQLLPTASDGPSGLIRPLRPIVAVLGMTDGGGSNAATSAKKAPGKLGSQGGKGL